MYHNMFDCDLDFAKCCLRNIIYNKCITDKSYIQPSWFCKLHQKCFPYTIQMNVIF